MHSHVTDYCCGLNVCVPPNSHWTFYPQGNDLREIDLYLYSHVTNYCCCLNMCALQSSRVTCYPQDNDLSLGFREMTGSW